MKKVVPLFACFFIGSAAQAQETNINKKRLQERAQSYLQKLMDTTVLGKIPNLVEVTPSQKGVKVLPQDGMPCIVPDTRRLVPMPNALAVKATPEAGRIPNAWNGKMKVMPVK